MIAHSPNEIRQCSECKTAKPASEFYPRRNRGPGYYRNDCKVCSSNRTKAWQDKKRIEDPEFLRRKNKATQLRVKFGLTLEQYEQMVAEQGGLCKICGRSEIRRGKPNLAVDHDHACCDSQNSCGRCIRGLICNRCNSALGFVNDNRETLQNMIEYLDRYRSEFGVLEALV